MKVTESEMVNSEGRKKKGKLVNIEKTGQKVRRLLDIFSFVRLDNAENRLPMIFVLVFAVLCLLIGFSQKPMVYPVDYGQYEQILKSVGLALTEEDLTRGALLYERPITHFAYTHFSMTNLLTPDAGRSVVYLIAIVRLFTEPFGLPFSVDAMAFTAAILLFLALFLLAKGLRRLLPRGWFIPVIFLCLLYTNGNFCAMFRGLYPEGPAILFSLLFSGSFVFVLSIPREKRGFGILWVLINSFIMLKSAAPMVVFLPFAAAADVFLLIDSFRRSGIGYLICAVGLLILLTGCVSTVHQMESDLDYFSEASLYESAFNIMLPASDNPEFLLIELGLDKDYLSDIGKSYYEEGDSFVHNPRNPEEAEKIFSKINTDSLFTAYLLHPNLLHKVIDAVPVNSARFFENSRYREKNITSDAYVLSRSDGGLLSVLWAFIPHSYNLFTIYAAIEFFVCLAAFILKKDYRFLLINLFLIGSAAYLPFCVILNGYSLAPQYILIQYFLEFVLLLNIITAAVVFSPYVQQWITKYMVDPYFMPSVKTHPYTEGRIWNQVKKAFYSVCSFLTGSKVRVMCMTVLMGVSMLLAVYLRDDHPISVNNGDFGRMMEQLDLMWTGDVYFDSSLQMGRFGIEDFYYLRPFDPLKLTPLKPTFSLYWFASLVRLLTEPFGKPFSTMTLAWIMSIISLLCVLKIVYDLYPLLKRWTFLIAILLCTIFYSETMLTWYNSLFGESCILLGILMSVMCIVHLCVIPQHGKGSALWMLGLAFSLYIMVGAKSQMLLTAPGAVIIFIILAYHHRPYRYDLFALYGIAALALAAVLAYSAFSVFQSERTAESTSQKHTMWQAYFYGIFMISDDPISDMQELGVDTAMAADIGKYVQFDDPSMYVYAPLSDEAQTAFYDHVSMLTIIKWYLTHPSKLWYMMNYAASQAQKLYTGFRVYYGQDYSDPTHDNVDGLNLWPGWRAYWTPGTFLGYIVFYGVLLYLLVRLLLKKNTTANLKICCCIPLFLIMIGVIQFPISVIGNGFVDNQKQMFGFVLCHDLLMSGILALCARYLFHLSLRFSFLPKVKKWLVNLKGIHAGVKDN